MNELLIVDKQLIPEDKPSVKREMEIIQDDSFNYDGYEVVRENFSHISTNLASRLTISKFI